MRNGAVAAAVVAVAIVAFAAGFEASSVIPRTGGTVSSTSTVSTLCTIPAEGSLILTILNSSTGKPLPSVPVQLQNLPPACAPNPHTTETLGTMTTGSNGTITTGGLGEFYLMVDYSGSYLVEANIGPVKTTCVTLSIPSGEVHIQYSAPFASSC